VEARHAAVRRSRALARLAAVALGLALTPLALEGALRFAALFVGARATGTGRATILCQGDSYTFGLFLPPEAAYPARLEQLLRAHGAPEARVVNAGIPSKPTWIVKQELRADLVRFEPQIVLLLAGINDHWRVRPADHEVEARGRAREPWRIVKTFQWLRARGERPAQSAPPPPELRNWVPTDAVTQRPGLQEVRFHDRLGGLRPFEIVAGEPSVSDFCAWIEEDMSAAVRIAREQGVVPVLLAYPATGGHFDPINETLARVAAANGTPFVDPRPEFAQALQQVDAKALFFPDQHTTDVGAALMARVVLRELARAGLVEVDSVPPALEAVAGWRAPELAVEPVSAGPGARASHVRVRFAPGYGAVLFLARSGGETLVDFQGLGDVKAVEAPRRRAHTLPLARDALLERTLARNEYRTVTLGADGSGLLPVPWGLAEGEDGPVLGAVAIVLPKVGPVLAVSGALELRP
jgi:lysophospholipase L1-like esterase